MATLLIIDDDSVVRDTLYEFLSPSHVCHTADRAEQALEYLEIEDYDVVLADIVMPGLGGLEILKRIKENHPTTPVIIITGRIEADRETILQMGAFDFFAKPLLLDEVETAIIRAIAHRQRMQSSSPTGQLNLASVDPPDTEQGPVPE